MNSNFAESYMDAIMIINLWAGFGEVSCRICEFKARVDVVVLKQWFLSLFWRTQ